MLSTQKLKSKRGISLPIAMAITAVLVILSASLIAIALTSITTTSSSVNSRQAYLNARSAIEYAQAYYGDSDNVKDISEIDEQYMVMNDKEGGTTSQGASFVDTLEDANEYGTYVVAKYVKGATAQDDDGIKLVAYSKSTDAFGGKSQEIHIGALYYLNKMANKKRLVNTNVDMSTTVDKYESPRNGIQMHVKQYPGQDWTPFYYIWTYKDKAHLYNTDLRLSEEDRNKNLFGLESLYKNYNNNYDTSYKSYMYTWYDQYGNKTTGKIPTAMNTNQKTANEIVPEYWYHDSEAEYDPKNGPATYFALRAGTNWYDTTYYTDDEQVNYFNMIITKKGKVLNYNGTLNRENVQSNEMFHLWYLNSADKNVYIEFLKPGLLYTPGSQWNGREDLDDRFLVYVNNSKTTLHFKVKGVGDGESGITAPTEAPTVISLNVKGASITTSDTSLDGFMQALQSGSRYGAQYLDDAQNNGLATGFSGRSDARKFFYGGRKGEGRLMYEGQGWWVLNVATNKKFSVKLGYYDAAGNYQEAEADVDPERLNPETGDVYLVAVSTFRGSEAIAYGSEQRACTRLGVDYKSYTTVHLKSCDYGTAIAPYLDYYSQKVSSTSKRTLQELIDKCHELNMADYDTDTFNNLQTALNHGTTVLNTDGKTDDDYDTEIAEIKKYQALLRRAGLDNKVYSEYKSLVDKCSKIIDAQVDKNDKIKEATYDNNVLQVFRTEEDGYKKAKELIDNKTITSDPTTYTTSKVLELISELQAKLDILEASKLVKTDITTSINTAKKYQGNKLYESDYLQVLDTAISTAEKAKRGGPDQAAIDKAKDDLDAVVAGLPTHQVRKLENAEKLSNLIDSAKAAIAEGINCTEASEKALSKEIKTAEKLWGNVDLTDDMLQTEYDNLLKVYNAFLIYKPTDYQRDDGTTNADSKTTDKLLSEYKYRLWLKNLNIGNTFTTYKEKTDGSTKLFENPVSIKSFSITCRDAKDTSFTILSRQFTFINEQNLAYIDVDNASIVSMRFSIGFSDGSTMETEDASTVNMYNASGFLADGNVIVQLDGIMHKVEKGGQSTYGQNTDTDVYYLSLSRHQTVDLFIEAPDNAVVEVKQPDGSYIEVPTVSEGKDFKYQVARYIYVEPDGDKKQTARVRYFDESQSALVYSDWMSSQLGQYVVRFDDTAEKTDVTGTAYTVEAPLGVAGVPVEKLEAAYFQVLKTNGTVQAEYPMETRFGRLYYSAEYPGSTVTFKIKRVYYDNSGREKNSISVGGQIVGAGRYTLEYTTDKAFEMNWNSKLYKTTIKDMMDVKLIKPLYTLARSGSGSGSSAALVSGIVSTTFTDKLMAAPLTASANTVTTNVEGTFDYFGQSGVNSAPTKNLGKTVIWLDCSDKNGILYKEIIAKGGVPVVYAWEYRQVEDLPKPYSATGSWPGYTATRVEDSPYWYVVVSSSVRFMHITSSLDPNTKIGGNPYEYTWSEWVYSDSRKVWEKKYNSVKHQNEIYLDIADTIVGPRYASYHQANEPGKCNIGLGSQGHCCLYSIIDQDVLTGVLHSQSYVGNGRTVRSNYKGIAVPGYGRGDVVTYRNYITSCRYRVKRSDIPRTFTYTKETIDFEADGITDLRMAFVGGSKNRIQNQSYFESYGTFYATGSQLTTSEFEASNSSTKITYDNLFGGNGGNDNSDGRVGDSFIDTMYDWYEYKIPVDQSDSYTFQIKGVQYVQSTVDACGKEWYEDGYVTDDKYTDQISNAYGNVYVVMKDLTTDKGIFQNFNVCTTDPEVVQIEDVQDVFFKLPNDNMSNPITTVKITASGRGGSKDYTMETDPELNSQLKASIPSTTPFLTFTVSYTDGQVKVYRTSLQGNDLVRFEPNITNTTYVWNNYVPDSKKMKRNLYAAHTMYYGNVLPKAYNPDGTTKKQNDGKHYWFANGLYENVIKNNFDSEGNPILGRISQNDLASYVGAYEQLYVKLAEARAYLPNHNYPEFIRAGKPDIYDQNTITALQRAYDSASNAYINSTSRANIVKEVEKLTATISNVSISNSGRVPLVFYDTQKLISRGYTIKVVYATTKDGVKLDKEVNYKTTEGFPIVFVEPAEREECIYNVKFVIRDSYGNETEGKEYAEIPLLDGAWVYVYQPILPPDRLQDTSYWVQNTTTDYREISNTVLTESPGDLVGVYDMTPTRKSIHDSIPVYTNLDDAKDAKYRPMTLYFKYDTSIEFSDSSKNYTIYAGAYTFDKTFVNTQDEISSKKGSGPFVYTNTGSDGWRPRINLFDDKAREYFTVPMNYGKYEKGKNAEAYGWVDTSNNTLRLTPGIKSGIPGAMNVTANDGYFEYARNSGYQTDGELYFRWQGNEDLKMYDDVYIQASEFSIALSGTLDASHNSDKHFYIGTMDDADSMDITFITDVTVKYTDVYGDDYEFVIREGAYTISRPEWQDGYIADLCDIDYWESMQYVKIRDPISSEGGFSGNGNKGRFREPVFTN